MEFSVQKSTITPHPAVFNRIHLLSAGLRVGDPVLRTGSPLSVELGPGKFLGDISPDASRQHSQFFCG